LRHQQEAAKDLQDRMLRAKSSFDAARRTCCEKDGKDRKGPIALKKSALLLV